ncbi:nucleoside triphosphate pyrophosphohydrolase [Gottfriedia solisilvae]|uniref:Phosphoribosyl-ATP pyrophosphohydrolase n=1 Tax=Gottfriedia solisilvae TaxID=1516104 RepID=A0A8J3EZW3_9BACI|nr:nucleoside triphosphate pyrophosphohydrolase [Gottfriedia solisilvae]GGI10914.1 phosphoribosyl-ATP pyrophosphohydrolase [Gottfriedia solisilvae]
MPIKYYNKLVRDKIPLIIEKTGDTFETEILGLKEYEGKLYEKLKEELEEFYSATGDEVVGEIADVLEVFYTIAETKGITIEEIEKVRIQKQEERGGFKERILLKHVVEK